MKVCKSIVEVQNELKKIRVDKTIGLSPTMGALHQGHLSLINASKKETDFSIATIFVNPAQFNKPEDLEKYPRTLASDLEKLESVGCHLVFMPSAQEIYPKKPDVKIEFGKISKELEGRFRPGHFDGVGLIISKLFNIIQPTAAFFGQKDIQQYFVIKKLIDELNFPVNLHMVATEREASGLAMSSRNLRLNEQQKAEAALIYSNLRQAQKDLNTQTSVNEVKKSIQESFKKSTLQLEYFEVVDTNTFEPLEEIKEPELTALCIAAEIGGVRLIDNLLLIS